MIDKADRLTLMESPAFRRLMLQLVQQCGVFDTTSTMGDGLQLYREGRRSVVLDLLRDLETANTVQSPTGLPILTSIQILREEVQSAPQKQRGDRNAYADLDDEE